MSKIKEINTCPLGSDCEKIIGDTIERCMWFVKLEGTNPNNGNKEDNETCAIRWLPLLQIEMANTNRGQTAALESFRNETVKGQTEFINTIRQRKNDALNLNSNG